MLVAGEVSQCGLLGPISIYILPLGAVIRQHNIHFHCYADDLQLYLSLSYKDLNSLDVLQACLIDLKRLDGFKLSAVKYWKVVIIGQSSSKNQIELALNKVFPNNKQVVRNWGIYFDTNLNFEFHVKKLVQSCFYKLKNISVFKF